MNPSNYLDDKSENYCDANHTFPGEHEFRPAEDDDGAKIYICEYCGVEA